MSQDNSRFVRKLIFWILALPSVTAVVVFALNNRGSVTIDLWPFGLAVDTSLFLALLLALALGVVLGGWAAWMASGATRSALREADYKAEVLRRELADARTRVPAQPSETPAPAQPSSRELESLPPPAA